MAFLNLFGAFFFCHPLGYPAFMFVPMLIATAMGLVGLITCIVVCGNDCHANICETRGRTTHNQCMLIAAFVIRGLLPLVYSNWPPVVTFVVVAVGMLTRLERFLFNGELTFRYLDSMGNIIVGILMLQSFETRQQRDIGIVVIILSSISMPILLHKCCCVLPPIPGWLMTFAVMCVATVTCLNLFVPSQTSSGRLDIPMLVVSIFFNFLNMAVSVLLLLQERKKTQQANGDPAGVVSGQPPSPVPSNSGV